eukprot:GAFH01002023.1.p1 GENE.GAFH01002023.1~~GAFH01002023.1.p1  ORF type:complete len:220 (-),score=26.67 GAFH01002023.1:660-1271(-)
MPVNETEAEAANGCPGTCQQDSKYCSGHYESGLCPGAKNIRCCISGSSSKCPGTCQDISNYCSGSYTAGLCPGGNNIQCCTKSPSPSGSCSCHFHQSGGITCSASGGGSYTDNSAYSGASGSTPADQCKVSYGPLPRGSWSIGDPYVDPQRGNPTFRLTPHGDTCGRSAFLIHAQGRSEGCICATQTMRNFIASNHCHTLTVS